MIISVNPTPKLHEFSDLMKQTDFMLNLEARNNPSYYRNRGGNPLEDDVLHALKTCAKGTPFENTIEKISGQKFPDIIAAKLYGVEVKSTKEDQWKSTGSSILESTRVDSVERIFMTFGKLGGNPIEFISRPYEECLSGIAVTHMPRYLIDMQLKKGETIFDKIGIEYDVLRKMEKPVTPVAKYYRERLRPGESLWWTGDNIETTVPATMRLWKNLTADEKSRCVSYGCVHFPEVFRGDYDEYSLWLGRQGIINNNVRDGFSAGGQELFILSTTDKCRLPAIFRRVRENKNYIINLIETQYEEISDPIQYIQKSIPSLHNESKINDWINRVASKAKIEYKTTVEVLRKIMFEDFNP